MIRSNALRNSARDQDCSLNIVGICNYDPQTTILAHLPNESGGKGFKSTDLCAVYACSSCHDAIDGRAAFPPAESDYRHQYYLRAVIRTQEIMAAKGLLLIKGAK